MSVWAKIIGDNVAQPVEAVGNVLDKLFTSDEEKLDRKAVLERIAQQPAMVQAEINKIEAAHRSIFVAGWRPFIGWVCGVGLCFPFLINPLLQWHTGQPGPEMPLEALNELIYMLLGLGVLRTVEKVRGRAK